MEGAVNGTEPLSGLVNGLFHRRSITGIGSEIQDVTPHLFQFTEVSKQPLVGLASADQNQIGTKVPGKILGKHQPDAAMAAKNQIGAAFAEGNGILIAKTKHGQLTPGNGCLLAEEPAHLEDRAAEKRGNGRRPGGPRPGKVPDRPGSRRDGGILWPVTW